MGVGRTPQRTCLGCRTKKDRASLRRLALTQAEDGGWQVVWDPKGVLGGRGGWLCPGPKCLEAALKRRALGRAFKTSENLDLSGLVPADPSGGERAGAL